MLFKGLGPDALKNPINVPVPSKSLVNVPVPSKSLALLKAGALALEDPLRMEGHGGT